MTKKVASSSWLTQIDHRLMAAEALRNVATTMGRKIGVEIRLNDRDSKAAEVVIFASDLRIQRDQFNDRFLDIRLSTDRTTKPCIETAVRKTNQGIVSTLERTPSSSDPARRGIGLCRSRREN